MSTYCEDCDNVITESRKRFPSQWLCSKFPRLDGMGYVAPRKWANDEPFMRCTGINGGQCPLWSPLRNGQRDNGL